MQPLHERTNGPETSWCSFVSCLNPGRPAACFLTSPLCRRGDTKREAGSSWPEEASGKKGEKLIPRPVFSSPPSSVYLPLSTLFYSLSAPAVMTWNEGKEKEEANLIRAGEKGTLGRLAGRGDLNNPCGGGNGWKERTFLLELALF